MNKPRAAAPFSLHEERYRASETLNELYQSLHQPALVAASAYTTTLSAAETPSELPSPTKDTLAPSFSPQAQATQTPPGDDGFQGTLV